MGNFDQEIMARTAIGEARGEGDIAMQAVMWTILNRFTAKKWFSGQSIAGTALKFEQYDCWMPKDPNYGLIANMTPAIGLLAIALQWADNVMTGVIADPTLGATHYYDDSISPPDWVGNVTPTVKIGRLNFFKGVS